MAAKSEGMSNRDKVLVLVAILCIGGGAAAFFLLRGNDGTPGIDPDYAKTPVAQPTDEAVPAAKPRDLKVQDTPEVPRSGGPRANPDYKPPN
jgi:hypothetical protein